MEALIAILVFVFVFWLTAELRRPPEWLCRHGKRVGKGRKQCAACQAEAEEQERLKKERERVQAARAAADLAARRAEIARERKTEAKRVRDLSHLMRLDPVRFETLVLDVYRRLGWDAKATATTGDRGVDGYLSRAGERVVLQCKRITTGRVGAPVLRDLLGTVVKEGSDRGILVTTSSFTEDALTWAEGVDRLELIDGRKLVQMVQTAYPEGSLVPEELVTPQQRIVRAPNTCPECGSKIRRVNGPHGAFMGCSSYPECRWTRSIRKRTAN